jgi:hypothetical protein
MHEARTQEAPVEGSDGTTPARPVDEGASEALIEELNECIIAALAASKSADLSQRDPVLIAVTNGLLAAKCAGVSTKAVERGVLLGIVAASTGSSRMDRHVAETSSALVRASARLGGDVGAAARGAIENAAAAAESSGLDVERVASAAADGATLGAKQLGSLAHDRVSQICRGTIRRLLRT